MVRGILLVILAFFSLEGYSASVFGRYTGVLRHESAKRDQLAKLELIASREDGNTLFLKAVLTLHFGDFANKEYVAYHFDDVRFNLLTQTFVFDQPDQPVTLVTKQLSGNRLEGTFRSSYSGDIGKVLLSSEKPVLPEYPLIEPVWGEYKGLCESKIAGKKTETVVQLYTYRSSEGAGQVGNPFRAYKIKGFIGEDDGSQCISGTSKMCVWGNVRTGAYNFFKNQLQIFNTYKNLNCTTEPDGIRCGGCDLLKRVSNETAEPRALEPLSSTSVLEPAEVAGPALVGDVDSIQGEYVGWVHHEYLNRYQLGSLNILTYQVPTGPSEPISLRMSALASLYFGDEPNLESISYRFTERSYPNPLGTPQFVFSQPDADVDAILQITGLGKGVVKGIWFSQVFGRVGSFEFHKTGAPKLPSDAIKFETISGAFQGTNWDVNLMVALGISSPGTENPFAPLTFGGYAIMPSLTPKKHITGGTYDFYTGRIGIDVGDDVSFVGERPSGKRLGLQKLHLSVTSPLPTFGLEPYRRKGE